MTDKEKNHNAALCDEVYWDIVNFRGNRPAEKMHEAKMAREAGMLDTLKQIREDLKKQ